MLNIKVIIPSSSNQMNQPTLRELQKLNLPDVKFDVVNLTEGPVFLMGRYDEHKVISEIIAIAQEAEKAGFHGIFVSCFYDTAVSLLREIVKIPVMGPLTSSILTAHLISQTYAIITVVESVRVIVIPILRAWNLHHHLSGIYVTDLALDKLHDFDLLLAELLKCSEKAVSDGAQALILGCTGIVGLTEALTTALRNLKILAPVIDPTTAAIMQLYGLCKQSLSKSPLSYPICYLLS